MKYTIDEIMEMLASSDELIQHEGIAAASEVKNLKCFMQPEYMNYGRATWDSCAQIVVSRSDDELKDYIIDMLLWAKNINWWGSIEISERLMEYKDKKHLGECIKKILSYDIKKSMKKQLREISEKLDLNIDI